MSQTKVQAGLVDLDGAITVNESSADVDFRIESNGNANMLFVNGGTDRVGIGTNDPDMFLDITGTVDAGGGSDEKLQQWNINSDNVKAEIEYLDASANRGYAIGTSSQHDFHLRTHDTIRLKVDYTGKVGVNETGTLLMGYFRIILVQLQIQGLIMNFLNVKIQEVLGLLFIVMVM